MIFSRSICNEMDHKAHMQYTSKRSVQPTMQGQLYCVMSSTVTSNKSQKKSEEKGKNILIFLCCVLSVSNDL